MPHPTAVTSRYLSRLAFRFRTLYFIHVPRTGGKYVTELALRQLLRPSRPRWRAELERALWRRPAERGAVYVSAHGVGTTRPLAIPRYHRAWTHSYRRDPELDTSLVFATIRNPFDLLVSMYTYGFPYRRPRAEKRNPGLDAVGFPFGSFEAFVQAYCDPAYPWLVGHQQRFLYFQLFDDHGHCVPHVLVRSERLDEGLQRLLEPFGVRPAVSPERVNRSAREPDYRAFYSDELRRLVEWKCARELEAFGYTFDGDDGQALIDPRDLSYNPHTDRLRLWRQARAEGAVTRHR